MVSSEQGEHYWRTGGEPGGTMFKQFSINLYRNTESILISHRPHCRNNTTIADELQSCSEMHRFVRNLLRSFSRLATRQKREFSKS